MNPALWPLPISSDFVIKDTPESGRAVFATTDLRDGTAILTTTADLSPLAHVIQRPYRREVCAQCFLYDRGREWKLRDLATFTAFCSDDCQRVWRLSHDALTVEAMVAVEKFVKASTKHQNKDQYFIASDVGEEQQIHALDEVVTVWKEVSDLGAEVIQARRTPKPTKHQRTALRKACGFSPDLDILAYILSGVLAAYKSPKLTTTSNETGGQILLPSLYSLAEDSTVFLRTPTTLSPLSDYTSSYLVLLALLPGPFLDLLSSDLVINLASRASHNAFSIRPEGVSDGDQSGEFLGWGVWPEASFFNHSCRPNLRKERQARAWSFWVDAAHGNGVVDEGEQLCITYMGGDERDLDVNERRRRLMEQWGFRCACVRCMEESGEKSP